MATLTIELPDDLAGEFEMFCDDVGMSVSSAVGVLAKRTVRGWKFPFEVKGTFPHAEMLEALHEAEDMRRNPDKYPVYHSIEEMNAALDAMDDEDDDDVEV